MTDSVRPSLPCESFWAASTVAVPAAAVSMRFVFSPFQPPGFLATRKASVAPARREAMAAFWILLAPGPWERERERVLEGLPPRRLRVSERLSSAAPVRDLTAALRPAAAMALSRKFLWPFFSLEPWSASSSSE